MIVAPNCKKQFRNPFAISDTRKKGTVEIMLSDLDLGTTSCLRDKPAMSTCDMKTSLWVFTIGYTLLYFPCRPYFDYEEDGILVQSPRKWRPRCPLLGVRGPAVA